MFHPRFQSRNPSTEDKRDQTVTPEERDRYLRSLTAITQEEWHKLYVLIKGTIPPHYCDPEDAVNEGLLIALRKYDGRGPLHSYVAACAWRYAFHKAKKRRHEVTFTDLKSEDELEEYLDEVGPYIEDPRYVEAVDELFVRRIEEILAALYDWHHRHSTHEAINDANRLLAILRDNANLGKGIGVDEYEIEAPRNKRQRGQPSHNTLIVRKLLIDHLRAEMQKSEQDVYSALKALRVSTRQALNEGWLPA